MEMKSKPKRKQKRVIRVRKNNKQMDVNQNYKFHKKCEDNNDDWSRDFNEDHTDIFYRIVGLMEDEPQNLSRIFAEEEADYQRKTENDSTCMRMRMIGAKSILMQKHLLSQ